MSDMSKGILFLVLGFITLMASLVMFRMGHDYLHLAYCRAWWFLPIPPGLIFGGIGMRYLFQSVKS